MKWASVIKGLTLAGRLRRRMRAILAQVEDQTLPRMDAGDLIRKEIVEALVHLQRRDARELLCDAQLHRASLYASSGGATPLDAAKSLLAAHDAQRDLPPNAERATRLADVADSLYTPLERLGSRRTLARLVVVMLDGWAEAEVHNARTIDLLRRLPAFIRGLREVGEDPGIAQLLASASRFGDLKRASQHLQAARREGIEALLFYGDSRRALAMEQAEPALDAAGRERLALALADGNVTDAAARQYIVRLLEIQPKSAARLSPSLRRLTHIGVNSDEGAVNEKERLTQLFLAPFCREDWPYRNQSSVAALRGDAEEAVAWFAAAVDRGGEAVDLTGLVAASLAGLGFDDVALELVKAGGAPAAGGVVGEAIEALRAASDPSITDTDQGNGEHLLAQLREQSENPGVSDALRGRLLSARGALATALGRAPEGIADLERALRLRPDDCRLAADLGEAVLRLNETGRALDFARVAESGGRTRRTCLLRADIAEARGALHEALGFVEEALESPSRGPDAESDQRAALKRIEDAYVTRAMGVPSRSAFLQRLRRACAVTARRRSAQVRPTVMRERAADLASALGDHQRELDLLVPAIQKSGAKRALLLRGALAAMRAGDGERADALLHRLRRRRAVSPEVLGLAGIRLLSQGNDGEARRLLDAAMEGGDSKTATSLARALVALMQDDAVVAQGLLDAHPGEPGGLVLGLRALTAERLGDWETALRLHQEAVGLDGGEDARNAFGILAVSMALAGNSPRQGDHGLLERGIDALTASQDTDGRALRVLGELARGKTPHEPDRVLSATVVPGTVQDALCHRLIRWHLEHGRYAEAAEQAEFLDEDSGREVREHIRLHSALMRLQLGREGSTSTLSLCLDVLATAGPTPLVLAACELVGRLLGKPVERVPLDQLSGVPSGLRLAIARLDVVASDVDRARGLVTDLAAAADDPISAEARVLLSLMGDTGAQRTLARDAARARPGAFPFLDERTTRTLQRRAACLAGLPPDVASGESPLDAVIDAQALLSDVLGRIAEGAAFDSCAADLRRALDLVAGHGSLAPEYRSVIMAAGGRLGGAGELHARALDLQRRALEADALSAVDAVSRHKEALDAFVAWLDHPDAFAHLNDDPCALRAASDALRCDLVGYQGFLALQYLDSDRDRCAGHVRLFLDSPLSTSSVDERREALLERVLEGLSTGDRMRRRLETIQYADPENEAVRVRLKAVRANRTARSEAVTSGHRTLDEARRLHEAGTLDEAETLLDNLFEQSGRSDPVLAREAINLLNAVRRERDEAQKDACLKHLKKTLELGRSREVLESTGGRTPLPSLEPALVLLRIRALTRLGYIDRSAFEFKQLGRDRILPADLLAERDDLEIEVALLEPKRRLREEWTDALQMWHRREDERLIMALAEFEGRYPGEPGIPFLASLALHRLGREAEAREQSEEAVRRARHGPPSFLTAMILRLRDRAVEPRS